MMTTAKPIRIGLSGALGRMGRVCADVVRARPDLELVALIDRPDVVGQVLDGLTIVTAEQALPLCDVLVDFSTPQVSAELATLAAGR